MDASKQTRPLKQNRLVVRDALAAMIVALIVSVLVHHH